MSFRFSTLGNQVEEGDDEFEGLERVPISKPVFKTNTVLFTLTLAFMFSDLSKLYQHRETIEESCSPR